MNRHQFKCPWGKFTDDDLIQIEGDYDKFTGKVKSDMEIEGSVAININPDARESLRKGCRPHSSNPERIGRCSRFP